MTEFWPLDLGDFHPSTTNVGPGFLTWNCFHTGDCKYKFGNWGECDTETGLKTRNGTLKKALFNAECEQSVKVTKSCDKSKTKSKGQCSLLREGARNSEQGEGAHNSEL